MSDRPPSPRPYFRFTFKKPEIFLETLPIIYEDKTNFSDVAKKSEKEIIKCNII